MAAHVYRKFPNHIEAIRSLLHEDSNFREICTDYEEICTWLDSHDRSEGPLSKEGDLTREFVRELEAEITRVLRGADP